MDPLHEKSLIYKSRYRGMKELDLVFRAFQDHIRALNPEDAHRYGRLLEAPEDDLYRWLVLGAPPPKDDASLVALIRRHASLVTASSR